MLPVVVFQWVSFCSFHCSCERGCPWDIPEELKARGILLRRNGPNESLFRFWARHGRALENVHLDALVKRLLLFTKTEVVVHEEKRSGLKSQLRFVLQFHYILFVLARPLTHDKIAKGKSAALSKT